MDSQRKDLEMHNPPSIILLSGQLKCSDLLGGCFCWLVCAFHPAAMNRKQFSSSEELLQTSRGARGLRDLTVTAARNSGSSGRDSEGILPMTSVKPVHTVWISMDQSQTIKSTGTYRVNTYTCTPQLSQ